MFRYASTLVPSSLSSTDTSGLRAISRGPFPRRCAPDEGAATVACGIGWATLMAQMQLQQNASRRALLWTLNVLLIVKILIKCVDIKFISNQCKV
jgi:hypothetical protein